ncbi:MAG: GGDEF domain-containing protein [Kiritimatiellia bacterium]
MSLRFNSNGWLSALFASAVVLVCGTAVYGGFIDSALEAYPALENAPLVLFGLGLALAVFFGYSRFFCFGILLCGFVVSMVCFTGNGTEGGRAEAARILFSVYVPCFTAVVMSLPERPVLGRAGLFRTGVVVSGVVAAVVLARTGAFSREIGNASWFMIKPVSGVLGVPRLSICFFLPAVVYLLFLKGALENSFPRAMAGTALLCSLGAMNWGSGARGQAGATTVLTAYMSAGALMLPVMVLHSAWRHANIDELTGLAGRRAMENQLNSLGKSWTLAVIDIDHFKKINDGYGHHTGDQVLRFIASEIENTPGCRAYRYGGEEFVVVFGKRSIDEVVPYLEGLRKSIARKRFGLRKRREPKRVSRRGAQKRGKGSGKVIRVTVSIGVTDGTRHNTPADAIKAADKSMYRAKRHGRNRLCRSQAVTR